MHIKLKDIGSIKQAEFDLADLTIICGHNNTGKTYATYALFGFLDSWQKFIKIDINDKIIEQLFNDGTINIDLEEYIVQIPQLLKDAGKQYTKQLHHIFSSSKARFAHSSFDISFTQKSQQLIDTYEREVGSNKDAIFLILLKEKDSKYLNISFLKENKIEQFPYFLIKQIITNTIIEIIFSNSFNDVFISSAERTGAAIFANELDFSRNKLLKEISQDNRNDSNILFELLNKTSQSDYALPVEKNVEFIRQLKRLFKEQSFIQEEHPEILTDFQQIIGGEYTVDGSEQLYFKPDCLKIKLSMDESSSSVRSLLDIGFYLRHIAKKGDLLIIDEPELNLHPKNQRCIARLFARLINIGIRVFITTHSDYIIKELNTLIMLHPQTTDLKDIANQEGYQQHELLSAKQVKVYIAKKDSIKLDGKTRKGQYQTLVATKIDPKLGIDMPSFDETINEMNRIQDAIIWSD